MKLTILLADAAQAVNGKLYILGGGWSIAGPEPTQMAIAIKVEVPWNEANQRHTLQLALVDEDGHPVAFSAPAGTKTVEVSLDFEVGRPPGLKPGTPLDVPLAINLSPLPLPPDRRYVWRCAIDGRSESDWEVSFTTRPTHKTSDA